VVQRVESQLAITVASVAHTLTLPAAVSRGVTGIQGIASNVITFGATGTYILNLQLVMAEQLFMLRNYQDQETHLIIQFT